ncbi:tetratricopeptide repeat protein [bacterium]|nr:tetratricopeptide repeat protein [bacterium]
MTRLIPLALLAALAAPALAQEKAPTVPALEARLAALLATGAAMEHQDAYQTLLADASALAGKAGSERAYLVIARCCEALGKHPEKEMAFRHYTDALLAHSKGDAEKALRSEAEALIARRELYAAIKVLERMRSLLPDGTAAAYATYRLGACHLWMAKHEEAARAFTEVVQQWPKDPLAVQAALRLVRCHLAQGTPGDAVAVLAQCLADHADTPFRDALLFDTATAHAMAADPYGALVAYQRLLREAPDSPYADLARAGLVKLRSDVLKRFQNQH